MAQATIPVPVDRVWQVWRNQTGAIQSVGLTFTNTKLLPALVGYSARSDVPMLDEVLVRVEGKQTAPEVSLTVKPGHSLYLLTQNRGVEVAVRTDIVPAADRPPAELTAKNNLSESSLKEAFADPKALLSQMGYPGNDPIFKGMADSFKRVLEGDE